MMLFWRMSISDHNYNASKPRVYWCGLVAAFFVGILMYLCLVVIVLVVIVVAASQLDFGQMMGGIKENTMVDRKRYTWLL